LISDIFKNEKFKSGEFDTDFLKLTYPEGFKGPVLNDKEVLELYSISAAISEKLYQFKYNWSLSSDNYGIKLPMTPAYINQPIYVSINDEPSKMVESHIRDEMTNYKIVDSQIDLKIEWEFGSRLIKITDKNGKLQIAQYQNKPFGFSITYKGSIYNINCKNENQYKLSKFINEKHIASVAELVKTPMPGSVVSINCKDGSVVRKGDELFVIEAMKMQNVIKSPREGVVKSVKVKFGEQVTTGQVLLNFV
jgi:propionyl-CoA carboxylase alpha chain